MDLGKNTRKQVNVSKNTLMKLRDEIEEKKLKAVYGWDYDCGENGYVGYAKMKDWEPFEDLDK